MSEVPGCWNVQVASLVQMMLFILGLFIPNMLPVAICITPVTTPSLSELLPFNADVRNPL